MKVFLSWSGPLSRELAIVLRKYLPCMIQGLNVFMSKHDLQSGVRWSIELARELEDSHFGIICLTADNLNSQWLLFEAGALTKHVEGRACGLLFDNLTPTDITGPLSQFQNKCFEEGEFRSLLHDMNAKLPSALGTDQLDLIFARFWPDILSDCQGVLAKKDRVARRTAPRSERDILEEVLSRVRGIERNVESSIEQMDSLNVPQNASAMNDAAREVLRCRMCGLVQYRTAKGSCRRCREKLPDPGFLKKTLTGLKEPQLAILRLFVRPDGVRILSKQTLEKSPMEDISLLESLGFILPISDMDGKVWYGLCNIQVADWLREME